MYKKKEKANHSSYLHDSHISLSAPVLIDSLSLQQIRSCSSLESRKIVQIFLFSSQGEAHVFSIFTRLLGTSRSVYWSPQVLTVSLFWFFDSPVNSGIWTDLGVRGQSQTIVSLTTPPGSASHTKGTFTSSKTLQQNLHGALSDDLVAFSCKLVPPVFSPSCFLFVCFGLVCFFASDWASALQLYPNDLNLYFKFNYHLSTWFKNSTLQPPLFPSPYPWGRTVIPNKHYLGFSWTWTHGTGFWFFCPFAINLQEVGKQSEREDSEIIIIILRLALGKITSKVKGLEQKGKEYRSENTKKTDQRKEWCSHLCPVPHRGRTALETCQTTSGFIA